MNLEMGNSKVDMNRKRIICASLLVLMCPVALAADNYTLDAKNDDTHVVFRVPLKAARQQLHSHLLDVNDRTLCSAMYVKLTRLTDATKVELTPSSDRKPKGVARAATQVRDAVAAKPVTLARDDILMADFEGKTFGDWEATGDAFKSGPTSTKGRIAGFQGREPPSATRPRIQQIRRSCAGSVGMRRNLKTRRPAFRSWTSTLATGVTSWLITFTDRISRRLPE